jgi:hypothetical protein
MNAKADAYDDFVNKVETNLIATDDTYAWKSRVARSVRAKADGLLFCHHCMGITDHTEIVRMIRSIRHLEAWIEKAFQEDVDARADAASW